MKERNLSNSEVKGKQECGCRSCGRIYANLRAFDRHRIGRHGLDRKCAKNPYREGLRLTSRGTWGIPMSESEKKSLDALRSRHER